MKRKIVASCLLLFLATACSSEPRFERTPLNDWERRWFNAFGASAEVPADLSEYWVGESAKRISISMHVVHPPLGVLDDAQPLGRISIERLSAAEFESRQTDWLKSRAFRTGEAATQEFIRAWSALQPSTVKIDSGKGLIYFRRDVACPNGDLISAEVEWRADGYPDGQDYRLEDEAAFRRILNTLIALE